MFDLASLASVAITVGMHIHSVHTDHIDYDRNNSNVGIYLRANDLVFGTYRNTLDKQSVYAAYQILPEFSILSARPELFVGVVSGYQYCLKQTSHGPKQYGLSSSNLDYLIAPSIRIPAGTHTATRISMFGKAINLSVEYKF